MKVVHAEPPYEVLATDPKTPQPGERPAEFFVFVQGNPYPVAGPFKAQKDAVAWTDARIQEAHEARAALDQLLNAADQKIHEEVDKIDQQIEGLQQQKEAKLLGLNSEQAKKLALRR